MVFTTAYSLVPLILLSLPDSPFGLQLSSGFSSTRKKKNPHFQYSIIRFYTLWLVPSLINYPSYLQSLTHFASAILCSLMSLKRVPQSNQPLPTQPLFSNWGSWSYLLQGMEEARESGREVEGEWTRWNMVGNPISACEKLGPLSPGFSQPN